MPGFDIAWAAVAVSRDGEPVSPRLRPLLQSVYSDCLLEPLEPVRLKGSLERLLNFLSGDGRTNANCSAVDLFFANCQGWERDWTDRDMPEHLHDVMAMMGEALHDAVKDPALAANLGCLPEQLLDRLKRPTNS